MIGVSLSHGQDPWTSKQKTVHLSLHKVALHLHVGPQQQQAPGLHIEQRSKQHVTSAQQTIISPRHPILGGRTIAALQQQQPETSVSMLQHPIASEIRWSTRDPLVLPRVSETSAPRHPYRTARSRAVDAHEPRAVSGARAERAGAREASQ
jgi:hypothetical protein